MTSNISDNLQSLAVDIDSLTPLQNNSRRGDINSIMASYQKFGQVKPIVAVQNDDGGLTVIAGNHQLQAAKQLGWTEIAVSVVDLSSDDALAFALADNRISDLGTTDNELLYEMLTEIMSDDEAFFETLGWDDFSVASIENTIISSTLHEPVDPNGGWVAPEIVISDFNPTPTNSTEIPATSTPTTAPTTQSIVTQGSTTTGASGVRNAAIQFTIVFDTSEQQSKWYSFLKWLKDDPASVGDTTAERLLDFISQHSPKG